MSVEGARCAPATRPAPNSAAAIGTNRERRGVAGMGSPTESRSEQANGRRLALDSSASTRDVRAARTDARDPVEPVASPPRPFAVRGPLYAPPAHEGPAHRTAQRLQPGASMRAILARV